MSIKTSPGKEKGVKNELPLKGESWGLATAKMVGRREVREVATERGRRG